MTPAVFASLDVRPSVRDALSAAVSEGRASHAYLFVGAPGSASAPAAEALAKALVCGRGGCGTCDECRRVAHRTHPDVHFLEPASATGYLVEQVRDLIEDASRAPVRAETKVYLVSQADRLSAASANALLKTLEEPPARTVFVLLARSRDAVLPTIASRCQTIAFELVSADAAAARVIERTGASADEARIALSVCGSAEAAAAFLKSPGQQEARRLMCATVGDLARMDEWEVLEAAKRLVEAVRAPLADVKSAQEALAEQNADFLTPAALKELEARNKRELTARERSGMMEALACAESLLRDCMVRASGFGAEQVVNTDVAHIVERVSSHTGVAGCVAALEAVHAAADDLARNVGPQLTLEVMFFAIKEAFACRM